MPARKNRPGKCGTPGFAKALTPEERLLTAIFGRPVRRSDCVLDGSVEAVALVREARGLPPIYRPGDGVIS